MSPDTLEHGRPGVATTISDMGRFERKVLRLKKALSSILDAIPPLQDACICGALGDAQQQLGELLKAAFSMGKTLTRMQQREYWRACGFEKTARTPPQRKKAS